VFLKEEPMIRIKVQYDPSTRTFKLVDQEFKTLLEGDGLYDLAIPLMFEEAVEANDFIWTDTHKIAHA
jgi:hypothetical protein